MPRGVPNATPFERFQKKSKLMPSGCIEWQGSPTSHGYGLFGANYDKNYAHRWAWFFATGVWPEKLVCHRCDNRICVNYLHLFLGSDAENAHDAAMKNKMGRPHRLSSETRQEIKRLCGTGMRQRDIAHMFKTTQSTVSEINRNLHQHTGRQQDA